MANFLETPEGQAWAARYAAEHNGNLPGQQSGESLDEAIANLMWSQDFASATGQAPTQQDWEEAWWARQSDDSWFRPYLDLANEALRPDFFMDSPVGQSGGSGNAPYPGGGAGASTVPPSGSVTVPNPVTGAPMDWFGPERYGGTPSPSASAPAGSGRFSADYYKQLAGPTPGNAPAPSGSMGGTGGWDTSYAMPGIVDSPSAPPPVAPMASPATQWMSPAQAQQQNMQAFAQTITNPATYTLQGAIPRTVDYWGRESARNANALQHTSNTLARNIQGGANNIASFWQYLNQR